MVLNKGFILYSYVFLILRYEEDWGNSLLLAPSFIPLGLPNVMKLDRKITYWLM